MTDTGTITNVDITRLTDIHTITYNRLGYRTVRWVNVYKYLLYSKKKWEMTSGILEFGNCHAIVLNLIQGTAGVDNKITPAHSPTQPPFPSP